MDDTWVIFDNDLSIVLNQPVFWSEELGWVDIKRCTLYTFMQVNRIPLPNNHATWQSEEYGRFLDRYWREITTSDHMITASYLWECLGDVPVDMLGDTEEDFLGFPAGTSRYDIWHWFEEWFDISIEDLKGRMI